MGGVASRNPTLTKNIDNTLIDRTKKMEQAPASDMWGTPQFEKAYIEFLSEFDRLTNGLEWYKVQTPGFFQPPLKGAPKKPSELLRRCVAGEFDRANAVASLIKAEKLVREMYYNIPYNEFGRDMLRWCWLDGALGEFNHQWGLSDLSHAY